MSAKTPKPKTALRSTAREPVHPGKTRSQTVSTEKPKLPASRSPKAPSSKSQGKSSTPIPAPRDSKQTRLIALLKTTPGATIDQMMALTGWQAHSVRGTISGVLRKKLGLNVTCEPSADSNDRLYRIVGAVA